MLSTVQLEVRMGKTSEVVKFAEVKPVILHKCLMITLVC